MIAPEPVEVKDLKFQELRRVHLFAVSEDEESGGRRKSPVSLLAVSNKFGYVFAGCKSELLLAKTQELRQATSNSESKTFEIQKVQHKRFPLPSEPSHVVLDFDNLTLAVCLSKSGSPFALLFDVPTLLKENGNVRPFLEIRLSTTDGTSVEDFAWNPAIPNMFAACITDGSLMLAEIKGKESSINTLPATTGAKAISWSPKGKQLVIAKEGALVQLKPDLKEAKTIPFTSESFGWSPGGKPAACGLFWLSTLQFAGVFYDATDADSRPQLFIINTPKGSAVEFINYDDVCYSTGRENPHKYYIQHIPTWNLLLVASSNAVELAVLGQNDSGRPEHPEWKQWILEDKWRAELPLTTLKNETFPIGLTVDSTNQQPIPWGENSTIPSMPVALLLSTAGFLCPYHIINEAPNAAVLTKAAEEPPTAKAAPIAASTPMAPTAKPQLPRANLGERFTAFGSQPQAAAPPAATPTIYAQTTATPAAAPGTPAATAIRPVASAPALAKPATEIPKPVSGPAVSAAAEGSVAQLWAEVLKDEIVRFAEDMKQHKAKCSATKAEVGTEEEKSKLLKLTTGFKAFAVELEETTGSQDKEVKTLKTATLEACALLEDAKYHLERSKDPRCAKLLKLRGLDPASRRKLNGIDQRFAYVQQELQKASEKQSELFEQLSTSRNRGVAVPSTQLIANAILNNEKIIKELGVKLHKIQSQIQNLQNSSLGAVLDISQSLRKAKTWDTDLAHLADTLLCTQLSPSTAATAPRPVIPQASPEKQALLRSSLSQRPVSRIRSTRPATATESRLLSTLAALSPGKAALGSAVEDITPPSTPSRAEAAARAIGNQPLLSSLAVSSPALAAKKTEAAVAQGMPATLAGLLQAPALHKSPSAPGFATQVTTPAATTPFKTQPVATKPAFGIGAFSTPGATPTTTATVGTGLTFGKKTEVSGAATSATTAPPGATSSATSAPAPGLSFGKKEVSSSSTAATTSATTSVTTTSGSAGTTATITAAAPVSFGFGLKPSPSQPTLPTFGAAATTSAVTTTSAATPFGFGLKPSPSQPVLPAFGAAATTTSATTTTTSATATAGTTSFGFGLKPSPSQPTLPTFGAATTSGAAATTSTSATSATTSSTPAGTTSFSFGLKPSPSQPALPTFGAAASTSAATTTASAATSTTSATTSFSSGLKPSPSQPALPTFGSAATTTSAATTSPATTSAATTSFSFGLKPSPSQPALPTFGAAATTAGGINTTSTTPAKPAVSAFASVAPTTTSSAPATTVSAAAVATPSFSFSLKTTEATTAAAKTTATAAATTTATTSLFGLGTTGGSSIFGQQPSTTATTAVTKTTTAATFSFGQPTTAAATTATAATATTTTTPGLVFGKLGGSTSSIFGGTTAAAPGTTTTAPGLQSITTTTTAAAGVTSGTNTTSVFGQPALTTTATTSVFGQQPAATTATTSVFGQQPATTSVFGQQPAATTAATSVFGQQPAATTATTSIFGQQPAGTTSATPNVFGKPATTAATTAFGQKFSFALPATTASVFGQPAAATTTATTAVFGQTGFGSAGIFGQSSTGKPSVFGGTATTTAATTPATTAASGTAAFGTNTFGALGCLGGTPNPANVNKNVFGGGVFGGGASQTTSIFGGGSAAAATAASASPFGGQQQQQQQQQSSFGAFAQTPTKPAFGAPPAFGGSPVFGGSPTFGGSPAFGGAATFGGSPAFGGAATFGAAPAPAAAAAGSAPFGAFGANNSMPTFGALASSPTGGSGFAALASQPTPSFGGLASSGNQQPAFGAAAFGSSTPAFGGGGGAFSSWR